MGTDNVAFNPMTGDRVLMSDGSHGVIKATVLTGDNEYEATLYDDTIVTISYDPGKNAWVASGETTPKTSRRSRRGASGSSSAAGE